MRKIAPGERQMMRRAYVKKMIDVVRTQGFLSLTIQDIARTMNLSRASLYNYFSSKEDIIMELTNICIDYINEAGQAISNEELSYPLRFRKVFEQAVFSAIYASDIYLNDLKRSCPLLYDKKMQSRTEQLSTLHSFYFNGMKAGVFNKLNPTIIIMQDETVLRKLVNSPFLMEEELSLKQALYDYYEAKKFQVLKPEFLKNKENEDINEMVDCILQKLTMT
ncbi:TetR family transcriptional regulator [Bacillus sp. AFS076308]|uniref:TetR/AcrR family transcriptional regulator n=1 Tax=unclassified Bacillus (in: firmicutes) TaxID=185979 RepID=UPI000BF45780|nr:MULTISPECIES: TetR/AcrR family transcriptional regulator [unclassified Bacillus (in: firmicutes)]PFN79170.1 TetR family transcriptional regulator [Bacillus sp. AFS076308]PGV49617.1 TetR family transcriptional regulator [Bacillus sp. AFS037270]